MSNTKQVHIDALVPFDWASRLTPREAQTWAVWVMGTPGLKITQQVFDRYQPNEHGGRTAIYRLRVEGREAMSWQALARLADSVRRLAVDAVCEARDVDDRGEWGEIPTVRAMKNLSRRTKAQVARATRGKRWVTEDLGNGVQRARLVPIKDEETR